MKIVPQIVSNMVLCLFQICSGVCLANGETIKNMNYLKKIGVTHVLNTAEKHVQVRIIDLIYCKVLDMLKHTSKCLSFKTFFFRAQ